MDRKQHERNIPSNNSMWQGRPPLRGPSFTLNEKVQQPLARGSGYSDNSDVSEGEYGTDDELQELFKNEKTVPVPVQSFEVPMECVEQLGATTSEETKPKRGVVSYLQRFRLKNRTGQRSGKDNNVAQSQTFAQRDRLCENQADMLSGKTPDMVGGVMTFRRRSRSIEQGQGDETMDHEEGFDMAPPRKIPAPFGVVESFIQRHQAREMGPEELMDSVDPNNMDAADYQGILHYLKFPESQ